MSDDKFPDVNPYGTPVSPFSPGGTPPVRDPGLVSSDARTYGMLCHLLGLLTGFIGPLIIWLVKKDEFPFVDDQGKESLNFQISLIIGVFISLLLAFVCIGYFLMLALIVMDLVYSITGAIQANKGEPYRYPLTIRLIQ